MKPARKKTKAAAKSTKRTRIVGSTKKKVAKPVARSKLADARVDAAVVNFLDALRHPLKPQLQSIRSIILGVSPRIREGIKWNSPSFRTDEWFATINLRARDGAPRVWLILHTGAKVKLSAKQGLGIADPQGLLEWLAQDRCLVTFESAQDIRAKRAALEAILRAWIRLPLGAS